MNKKLKGSAANEKSIEEVNEKIQFVYENLLDEIAKQMDSNNRSLIEALLKAQNGEIKEMDKKFNGFNLII